MNQGGTVQMLRRLRVVAVAIPLLLFGAAAWKDRVAILDAAEDDGTKMVALVHEQAENLFTGHEIIVNMIVSRMRDRSWDLVADPADLLHELEDIDRRLDGTSEISRRRCHRDPARHDGAHVAGGATAGGRSGMLSPARHPADRAVHQQTAHRRRIATQCVLAEPTSGAERRIQRHRAGRHLGGLHRPAVGVDHPQCHRRRHPVHVGRHDSRPIAPRAAERAGPGRSRQSAAVANCAERVGNSHRPGNRRRA